MTMLKSWLVMGYAMMKQTMRIVNMMGVTVVWKFHLQTIVNMQKLVLLEKGKFIYPKYYKFWKQGAHPCTVWPEPIRIKGPKVSYHQIWLYLISMGMEAVRDRDQRFYGLVAHSATDSRNQDWSFVSNFSSQKKNNMIYLFWIGIYDNWFMILPP